MLVLLVDEDVVVAVVVVVVDVVVIVVVVEDGAVTMVGTVVMPLPWDLFDNDDSIIYLKIMLCIYVCENKWEKRECVSRCVCICVKGVCGVCVRRKRKKKFVFFLFFFVFDDFSSLFKL